MLLLTDEDIKSLMTVKDCLEVMELAYRDLAEGKVDEGKVKQYAAGPAVVISK